MGHIADEHLVREFARRTAENLEFVESAVQGSRPLKRRTYEVTQLINSLLGILVLPHEHLRHALEADQTPVEDLPAKGWPVLKPRLWVTDRPKTLGALVTVLRNGVAHYNIRFLNRNERIVGIRLWNVALRKPHKGKKTFEVELSIGDLKKVTACMLDWVKRLEPVPAAPEPPDAIDVSMPIPLAGKRSK